MKINQLLVFTICLILTNCSGEKQNFPLNKRYWDTNDYDKAILELRFGYENDEKKPTFDDPEQRMIVQKLTDEENYKVVLNDKELGLKHRTEISTQFFEHWQDMTRIYQARDRKDNYIYDVEMLAVHHFGLGLQLEYFKLGNEEIKESADDPSSARVKNVINQNIGTLVSNYIIYLDVINDEKSFSEKGISKLAEGIDNYFIKLVELYPDANYSSMKRKAELMLKKSESNKIKSSLTELINLIDSKSKKD